MKIRKKKTWGEYFQKVADGSKTFEIRLGNMEVEVGDVLCLKEWDPEKKEYTGREINKKVTYVLNTKDLRFWSKKKIEEHGLLVMGLGDEEDICR